MLSGAGISRALQRFSAAHKFFYSTKNLNKAQQKKIGQQNRVIDRNKRLRNGTEQDRRAERDEEKSIQMNYTKFYQKTFYSLQNQLKVK